MTAAMVYDVAVVAGEQLVAAVAGQRDLHMLASQLRDEVRRDGRYVGEWLVEGAQKIVEEIEILGADYELVMLGPEPLRYAACVGQLVVGRLPEADGERLDRDADFGGHERDDGGRIDATAQEGAERHVADQVRADGIAQHRPERLGCLRLVVRRRRILEARPDVPVAPRGPGAAVAHGQRVAGREFDDALDDAQRIGDVAELQVRGHRTAIDGGRDPGAASHRFQL